jgi:Flp pilus assembly protein TadG
MRTLMSISRLLAKIRRDKRGTSAVEFALIAPILAFVVVGLADINNMGMGAANMQTAVRAGAQYAMAGGTDAATAQTKADAAWTRKPAGGTISASRVCKCASTAQDCNTPCTSTNQWPDMYMTVTATGHFGGYYYSTDKTITETVRVR